MFWSKKKTPVTSNSTKNIVFEYFDKSAKSVFICGDFNSWNVQTSPLVKDSTGRWKITVPLAPGRYEYRFLVDGVWQNDQRPVYLVDNSFGTQNCLIEI